MKTLFFAGLRFVFLGLTQTVHKTEPHLAMNVGINLMHSVISQCVAGTDPRHIP